ncbi:hypothetical protein WQ57_16335 [Mesobacillus campisalis]|uniref:NAD-dependent epimerase/dehydratase domain-containing protein n=1 Tax=Mesobacillus campisalis TaxID=1408103 RepID=A0A0M2SVG7_9BACI|nr:hypothetical protein [Mesobacillus campisalis]KKK36952.1 hypothetical protein WQ57_16335 [Mesobacillus campisalis]
MDRAIIIGPFGFLGYSICKIMLDKGFRVLGISPGTRESGKFDDEKRLEIGRNANFFEQVNEEWLSEINKTPVPIIIPFYDYFMDGSDANLFNDLLFSKSLCTLSPCPSKVIFLFPEQFAHEKPLRNDILKQCEAFIDETKHLGPEIFLPTLYGPWQPDKYLFQQILFPADVSHSLCLRRESLTDAVYIEDAASLCLGLMEEAEGAFLVSSGNPEGWEECLQESLVIAGNDRGTMGAEKIRQELLKQAGKKTSHGRTEDGLSLVSVPKPMEIRTGLENQCRQYERWLLGQML